MMEKYMKKALYILLATIIAASSAHAQLVSNTQPAGGFEGPSAKPASELTIKQALEMRDDSIVALKGKIVNSLGDEKYTFRDATGDIIIEIDDEDWKGIKVTPENTIEIVGEVDKEVMEAPKIDVKSFSVMQ